LKRLNTLSLSLSKNLQWKLIQKDQTRFYVSLSHSKNLLRKLTQKDEILVLCLSVSNKLTLTRSHPPSLSLSLSLQDFQDDLDVFMINYLEGQLGFSPFSKFPNSVVFFFFFFFFFLLSLIDGHAFETVYGCWENVGKRNDGHAFETMYGCWENVGQRNGQWDLCWVLFLVVGYA
jgi:hypothetical protein